MYSILLLIQFMTRIPILINLDYDSVKIGRAIKYFPLVGLLIGAILSLGFILLSQIIDNKLIIALCIVVLEILITGGLHIDGLSDSFDGLFSYRDKDRILEIMKDPCIGANGALAMMIYVIAKILLIADLDWRIVLIMPAISRLNTVIHAGFGKYARQDGMGKDIVDETTKKGALFATICTLFIAFIVLKITGVLLVGVAILFGFLSLYYIQKIIDGITGDTMGAVLELTSVVILLFAVILK